MQYAPDDGNDVPTMFPSQKLLRIVITPEYVTEERLTRQIASHPRGHSNHGASSGLPPQHHRESELHAVDIRSVVRAVSPFYSAATFATLLLFSHHAGGFHTVGEIGMGL